jgi:hypothetical protein
MDRQILCRRLSQKAVRPRLRRKLAQWAQEAYRISERHAARLVGLAIGTLRYRSRNAFDEVLRHRLRELAGTHVRYGYRRLTVLLSDTRLSDASHFPYCLPVRSIDVLAKAEHR